MQASQVLLDHPGKPFLFLALWLCHVEPGEDHQLSITTSKILSEYRVLLLQEYFLQLELKSKPSHRPQNENKKKKLCVHIPLLVLAQLHVHDQWNEMTEKMYSMVCYT